METNTVTIDDCKYIYDGNVIWFSQLQIASIFNKSVKTINSHIKEIFKCGKYKTTRFELSKLEGSRVVRRNVLHYDFNYVYSIGIKTREYDKLAKLISNLKKLGFKCEEVSVTPVKERNFVELISTSLEGICTFTLQYPIDGYKIDLFIEQLNLAIEYDEIHHLKPKYKKLDEHRQNKIEKAGIQFIRVKEGKEYEGLNKIIKYLMKHYK